VLAVDFG